jgi:hypothetical protein
VYRFLLLVLYSMHARVSFAGCGLYFSESTLAIGIGDVGLARVDDVQPFFVLYASLCVSFDRIRDRILWVLVAHMLVRPGIIEALRNLVCGRRLLPSVETISEVLAALARRHGLTPSREAVGQRDWKHIDVFCLASTQTLGAKYCGSHKLYQQLKEFEKLERIADGLAALHGQTVSFSAIVEVIGSVGAVSYSSKRGYWTVHLARVFVPNFGGCTFLGGVTYGPDCAKILYHMGAGALSMVLLGITDTNVYERSKALCKCITAMGRTYGFDVCMSVAHLACAVCEAHRRNGMGTGAIRRRLGL